MDWVYTRRMKSLNAKFSDYLMADGWDVIQEHKENLGWWADEIWELRSRWPPVGRNVFVTFLVDPKWTGPRQKGQSVWAVGKEYPRSQSEAGAADTLSISASKEEIQDFIDVVDGFRAEPL